MEYLSKGRLQKLPTQRLIALLNSVRAIEFNILYYAGRRCCEICHEYTGSNWEKDVLEPSKPYKAYFDLIKLVLSEREHLPKQRQPTLHVRRVKCKSCGKRHRKTKSIAIHAFKHIDYFCSDTCRQKG